MVELRNDLLTEATRVYYERRRLRVDIVFTPLPSEQEHLENLLRPNSALESSTWFPHEWFFVGKEKTRHPHNLCESDGLDRVGVTGIEPATSCSQSKRSSP